jgi:glycosyltransferase involved in cell wall biosynthesis
MRVVFATSIFVPDIGGPATHAFDVAAGLRARGHEVTVLTFSAGRPMDGVVRIGPGRGAVRRHVELVRWLARRRRSYDVVYAASTMPSVVLGARLARRPVVFKVVGDPAWERAARAGSDIDFDTFQSTTRLAVRVRAQRWIRSAAARRADIVVAPSAHLQRTVEKWWLGNGTRVEVIPNGVARPSLRPRSAHPPVGTLRAVSVGRLVPWKRLDVVIDAVAATPGVTLDVVGDGPERDRLEKHAASAGVAGRVAFLGTIAHESVLAALAKADVLVSASTYEGLPHTLIESFAVGTPVITSTSGAAVVRHRVNGLVVDDVHGAGFADALRSLRDDGERLRALREHARVAGAMWSIDATVDRVEGVLRSVTRRRPTAVFCGRARHDPADPVVVRKFNALDSALNATFVGMGPPAGIRRVGGVRLVALPALRPVLVNWLLFRFVAAPLTVALAARRRPSAVVVQSPYEAVAVRLFRRMVPRSRRPRLVVEVHGDWHATTRHYGGVRRRMVRITDVLAARAIRSADRVRVVSTALESRVRGIGFTGPIDTAMTFGDFARFRDTPLVALPTRPVALFAGALEDVKGVDVLLAAWPAVLAAMPDARLVIAGDGTRRAHLEAMARSCDEGRSVRFAGHLAPRQLLTEIDGARVLVLPSRSEGLGRVVLEAQLRARPVVGTAVGGIPELVAHSQTGLLVPPDDAEALAAALAELLAPASQAAVLGAAGRDGALERDPEAQFEANYRNLAAWLDGTER